jgi:hypothetical protein
VGALAMSVSTIVVAANAMLLRNLDLRSGDQSGPGLRELKVPAAEQHEHHHP